MFSQIRLLLLLLSFLFLSTRPILASDNKNIFGLHLSQTSDLSSASKIINSQGGDWGWSTVVIRQDLLNHQQWQDFFDQCRLLHIIPIIRLSTLMENNYWKTPEYSDIDSLTEFLNSLNWPTQDQHIILFNEINHAQEWGGQININDYTDKSIYIIQKLKKLNPNFKVLSSGLDLAAPDKLPDFISAETVYQQIYQYNPQYFELIDGIASHSYPNHGYIGKPTETGQHSIFGYQWELDFLKSLGVSKTYPIFITETGWPHREGESNDNNFYTAKTSAEFLISAYQLWQTDPQIEAVTPFIYNFPYPPFDHFSWVDKIGQIYPDYQQLIDLPKNKNTPLQISKYELTQIKMPFFVFPDTQYQGEATIKNTGQSIWGEQRFCINPESTQNINLSSICLGSQTILPNQSQKISFSFKINKDSNHTGNSYISWQNTPAYQLETILGNPTIYHPNTGIKRRIFNFFQNLFI